MPKIGEFPRFRCHMRNGTRFFYYDMRGTGRTDIPLGTDRAAALDRWAKIRSGEDVDPWREPKVIRTNVPLGRPRLHKTARDWSNIPAWARNAYNGAEYRSRARKWGEFLTVDEFKAIVRKADGRCQLTSIALDESGKGRRPFAPSIDRIDASRGYVVGNVRIVCLLVNQALSEWGMTPVLEMAKALLSGSDQSVDAEVLEEVVPVS